MLIYMNSDSRRTPWESFLTFVCSAIYNAICLMHLDIISSQRNHNTFQSNCTLENCSTLGNNLKGRCWCCVFFTNSPMPLKSSSNFYHDGLRSVYSRKFTNEKTLSVHVFCCHGYSSPRERFRPTVRFPPEPGALRRLPAKAYLKGIVRGLNPLFHDRVQHGALPIRCLSVVTGLEPYRPALFRLICQICQM